MLNDLMLSMSKQLDVSVADVREREKEEVFLKYRRTVADLMATMLTEVMNPIYAHYPDLEPEWLRNPSRRPDRNRAFRATHRLSVPGESHPIEVMLYSPDGGIAHTLEQWQAFQQGACIEKPFWHCFKGKWWRNNDCLEPTAVESID